MSETNGDGRVDPSVTLTGGIATEAPLLLWICYHDAEVQAFRALGLDACLRQSANPDNRHVILVTGTGDFYATSNTIEDAQTAYGAGALSVRAIAVPTARGATAATLLINEVLSIADIEEMAELAPVIADAHIEPWPEITLGEAPEALPFPVDVFPPPLQRFCQGVASVTLTPPDMPGCAMLAVASAAIGQSVQVIAKRTWRESTLLYLLTVADPGKMKSPVIKLVAAPLARIDAVLRKESRDAHACWEIEKKNMPKGEPPPDEPPQRRAIVKDITRETLAAILRDNPRGILADPDEATAWVSSFNEYKSKGSDRQFWLAIWGGSSISVDREAGRRSIFVKTPLATVMGGLPPDMLGSLAEEHGRNDGFLDRILFCYPEEFPPQRWTEEELDQGDETTWSTIVNNLHSQDMTTDEGSGDVRPNFVGLDHCAKTAYVRWYDAHCEEAESLDMPPAYVGVWSKLRAYCLRFALILSRIRLALDPECTDLIRAPVLEIDMHGAISLISYFKSHFQRVNHRMTGGTGSREARAVLAWIVRKGVTEFRERDVRQDLRRRFPDSESVEQPLQLLIKSGAIRQKLDLPDPHRRGRRPTQSYEVNPALKERRELLKLLKNTHAGVSGVNFE